MFILVAAVVPLALVNASVHPRTRHPYLVLDTPYWVLDTHGVELDTCGTYLTGFCARVRHTRFGVGRTLMFILVAVTAVVPVNASVQPYTLNPEP